MSAATRVVNKRSEAFDVYIGRPSPFGNPYSHQDGTLARFRVRTRDEAIAAYEVWIQTQPDLLAMLPALRGKVLGCWCRPKKCHGDVLVRLIDQLPDARPAQIAISEQLLLFAEQVSSTEK
jgi:Domain of unknown function (DUF4326)